MRNLSEIRTEIDSIDEQIIELFKKRMDCAKEVGNYKKANNIPVLNQARENEILDAIEERGGEYGSYARLLYSNIMELSRALQHNIVGSGADIKEVISNVETEIPKTNVKVGYQGMKGVEAYVQSYNGKKAVIGSEIKYISGATLTISRNLLEVVEED